MERKLTKRLCYEGFQYGSGDVAVTSERNVLHLYEVIDSVPRSGNLMQKKFSFRKENNFLSVHGKKI